VDTDIGAWRGMNDVDDVDYQMDCAGFCGIVWIERDEAEFFHGSVRLFVA
jgi:hypothetical protein